MGFSENGPSRDPGFEAQITAQHQAELDKMEVGQTIKGKSEDGRSYEITKQEGGLKMEY